MEAKRLTKVLWHGSDIDGNGKAVAPAISADGDSLSGLNRGELYISDNVLDPAIFIRLSNGSVVAFRPNGDGSGKSHFMMVDKDMNPVESEQDAFALVPKLERLGIASKTFVSGFGISQTQGGGGGSLGLLTSWSDYNEATAGELGLSAYLGKDLLNKINAVKPTWSNITDKPFATLNADHFSVTNGVLSLKQSGKYWANLELQAEPKTDTQPTFKSVKIGEATLSWDDANKALMIDKGAYSLSFLSGFGMSDSGSGGGGSTPVIDSLTSDSTEAALSANMGRYLKQLIDEKTFTLTSKLITDTLGYIPVSPTALDSLYIGTTKVQKTSDLQNLDGIGTASIRNLKITSTSAENHIEFSRSGYPNYLIAPNADNTSIRIATAPTGAASLVVFRTDTGYTGFGVTSPEYRVDVKDSMRIGEAVLSWDSTNKALKISTGLYSESFVSGFGASASSGNLGGASSIKYGQQTFTANDDGQIDISSINIPKTWADITGKPTWIGSTKPSYTAKEVGALPKYSSFSDFLKWNNDDEFGFAQWTPSTSNKPTDYGTSLNFKDSTSWYFRLAFSTGGRIYYYRGINTTTLTQIGALAYTSDNVASATKLKDARTLWGQSFDGSANVSGNMTGVGHISMNSNCIIYGRKASNNGEVQIFYPLWSDNNTYLNFGWEGNFYIRNSQSTHVMTMLSSGNVGIGTTSPTEKLVVNGNIKSTASDTTYRTLYAENTNGSIGIRAATNRGLVDVTNNAWIVGTNGTDTWLSQGNVGIGTTSPTQKLEVNGNAKATKFIGSLEGNADTATAVLDYGKTSATIKIGYNGNSLTECTYLAAYGVTSGSQVVIKDIAPSNVYGVGSANKLANNRKLWGNNFDGTADVNGDIILLNNTAIQCKSSTGANNNVLWMSEGNGFHIGHGSATGGYLTYINGLDVVLRYGSSHTEGFRLTNTGNVGIGTNAPSVKLEVNGSVKIGGATLSWDSTNGCLKIDKGFVSNSFISAFGLGTANALTITPSANNTYDLGSNTYQWRYGYIGWIGAKSGNSFSMGANNGTHLSISTTGVISQQGSTASPTTSSTSAAVSLAGGMYIAKNLRVAGSVYYGSTPSTLSDMRYKDVIEDRLIGLDKMANAPLFAFRYKSGGLAKIGTSAQYWRDIMGEFVEGDERLTLDYSALGVALGISLAKHAKTSDERIAELEKKVNELENELKKYAA